MEPGFKARKLDLDQCAPEPAIHPTASHNQQGCPVSTTALRERLLKLWSCYKWVGFLNRSHVNILTFCRFQDNLWQLSTNNSKINTLVCPLKTVSTNLQTTYLHNPWYCVLGAEEIQRFCFQSRRVSETPGGRRGEVWTPAPCLAKSCCITASSGYEHMGHPGGHLGRSVA